MADNTTLNTGTGGDVIGSDDIAGVKYQRVKLIHGADGVNAGDVASGNPLPVTLGITDSQLRASAVPVSGSFFQATQPVSIASMPTTPVTGAFFQATQPVSGPLTDTQLRATSVPVLPEGEPVSYWPGYKAPSSVGQRSTGVDDGGALITRGAVLTDEGTFRVNFANTSFAVSIGTVSISGRTVTGNGFSTTIDVHLKDYFKLDADGESAWMQIESIDSSTQLTLVSTYVGGTSGAASRSLVQPTTAAGGTITVASGQCTLASGTTTGARAVVGRQLDYSPLVWRSRLSISQRIANQSTRFGLVEFGATARWYARFRAEGTTNTTVVCESARNPTVAPSGGEIESTTVTLPNGLTTATLTDYRVEMLTETVRFYIAGVLVAEHTRSIPSQYDILGSGVLLENTGTAGSNTNVVIDYITGKNHNKIEVGVMSDAEKLIASAAPLVPYTFSQAGIIAINTDLIVLDCSQLRSLFIQCNSMGTTGVVTVAWSNTADFAQPITATLLSEAGATSTTFNAAVMRVTNVLARYCRLRLTTATTAGTTTINVLGSQSTYTPIVTTQPVSGTVTANIGTGALAAGTNAIGDVGVQYRANATGAASVANLLSPATPAVQTIKAAAGRLLSITATNTNAASRFIKIWNTASGSITLGTTAALLEIGIPPNQTIQFALEGGVGFSTAINMAVTAGQGLTNNAAVTLGDVTGIVAFA